MKSLVPVSKLYVQCSFPMRPGWIAMSDCCRKPADSAVESAIGNLYWRCSEHRGMVDDGTQGIVHESVPRRS